MVRLVNRTLTIATIVCFGLLTACGGGASTSVVAPPLPPPPPPPPPPTTTPTITVAPVYAGVSFASPIALAQAPGDSTRWFVAEQGGRILTFSNDPAVASTATFLDIAAAVNSSFSESGLLGMAFHPGFPATPFVYVNYTITGSGAGNPITSRISRFQSVDGGVSLQAASEQFLLEIPQPFSNHNGGNLAFGPDGFLYAAFGDGGSGGDPQNNAQNDNNLLGTILRLDIDSATPYAIPPGNPNVGNSVCTQGSGAAPCPEIYAFGLRNPWKFSFDRGNGDLWAADVGQGAWEEVDRITLGGNYGWRQREGAHCFNPSPGCATTFIEPIAEYDRNVGQSVTGGYVYRGSDIADLFGWYVFADFVQGRLLGFEATAVATVNPVEFDNLPTLISGFAEGSNGELYLLDYGNGAIFQVVDN